MNITVTIPFTVMHQDFAADVDVMITHRSRPGTREEPGEVCEWEVLEGAIRPWSRGIRHDYLDTPKWLFAMIEGSDELAEAIMAAEDEEPRGRAARDPDEAHDRMGDER
jgi:hypothetical protein